MPASGHEQRRQDPEQRGLAAAVGADEAEQLAGATENDTPSSATVGAEALDEAVDDDRVAPDRAASSSRRLTRATNCTSAGMPIFSTPSSFGTRILTA